MAVIWKYLCRPALMSLPCFDHACIAPAISQYFSNVTDSAALGPWSPI